MATNIIVASTNPVKLQATLNAFERLFAGEDFVVEGVSVPSGVSDQPMTNNETLLGASNRAQYVAQQAKNSDTYAVGIEGGVEDSSQGLAAFAWVVVQRGDTLGKGRTGTFFLPDEVAELVRGGLELGDADDIAFGQSNSKQKNGAVGLLTGNVITRTTFYEQAVIMALVPFKNPQLSWENQKTR